MEVGHKYVELASDAFVEPIHVCRVVLLIEHTHIDGGLSKKLVIVSLGFIVPMLRNLQFVRADAVHGSAVLFELLEGRDDSIHFLEHRIAGLENEEPAILIIILRTNHRNAVAIVFHLRSNVDLHIVIVHNVSGEKLLGFADLTGTANAVFHKKIVVYEITNDPFVKIGLPALRVCTVGVLVLIGYGKNVVFARKLTSERTEREIRGDVRRRKSKRVALGKNYRTGFFLTLEDITCIALGKSRKIFGSDAVGISLKLVNLACILKAVCFVGINILPYCQSVRIG